MGVFEGYMKILLTAHHADEFRGVELFNWTIAKELSKNHDVYFFSFDLGIMSKHIKDYATIIKKIDQTQKFDMGIISHNSCYNEVSHLCKDKLFISHGIFSPLDEIPNDRNCRTYGVSEEVQWKRNTEFIIRNPVDTEKYQPQKDGGGGGILYLTNHPNSHTNFVLERMGMPLFHCKGEWKVEEFIYRADLVVTSARGAVESMACKKPTFIVSPYGFDGYCGEYWELKKNNFGGRRYKKDLSIESFKYELSKVKNVLDCYNYVIERHSVDKVVERLFREL